MKRFIRACLYASMMTLAFVAFIPSSAAASSGISVSFFAGHTGPVANGSAQRTTATSNDADPFSIQLDVPEGTPAPDFFSSFAGIQLHHVPSAAPTAPPSFDFKTDKIARAGAHLDS